MNTPVDRTKCLVIGGAKGIGGAIVDALAGAGHDVIFTYRASGDEAAKRAAAIQAQYPAAFVETRALDLSNEAAVNDFCARIADEDIHGLVYNAGQSSDALTALMDQAKAHAAMQVNFWAFTRIAQALLRPMMARRAGRIVTIGSVAALRGNQGNAAYAASKAALLGYVRTLAVESAKYGITANYIAPGFVDTDMMGVYDKYREKMEKQIPAGRFAQPEDIAALVAFLMSPGASYITGAVLPVDGGLTAMMGVHR